MLQCRGVFVLAVVLLGTFRLASAAANDALAWPPAGSEARPWSYWWWMGSAVDPANLTRELERYRKAGWGGVHIIPIYGARGYESRYIDYLSPRWMEMLRYTVAEAERLGLGVDMTTGTGWCFGGPNISAPLANAVAVPRKGPNGVYEVTMRPTVKVERAAPGGEGYMLNPFYGLAVETYLSRFSRAFSAYTGPLPRAMYHDSFEYQVDWSPDLPAEFARRRGYRLESEYPALFGDAGGERAARVKSDYRETISDMMLENFARRWVAWSHEHKFLTRNQAHGSPGNLLDLYAAADIPETEMFNRDRSTLVSKFASSAAHVTGKNLVAAETGTWLKEHFTETLADLKDLLDQLFLAGVNHVFYHGTCYSPDAVPWPGWLFYASTEMNPRNAIWHDVPALNAYIARSQTLLQQGSPDNDFLLYWPIYDLWHDPRGMTLNMTVHQRAWLEKQRVGELGQALYDRGYAFDFISDRQLSSARIARYRAVVVPACEHMPAATLAALLKLARSGMPVIFENQLPKDVPGWGNLEARRAEFRSLLETARQRVMTGDVERALVRAGVRRETMVDQGSLQVIRRRTPLGRQYFIANRGQTAVSAWVPLAHSARSVALMDPMSGRAGFGAARKRASGGSEVYLQLEPGESIFVRALDGPESGPRWKYWRGGEQTIPLAGRWRVSFTQGGPELPPAAEVPTLASWTQFAGEAGMRFAGTARYSLTFDCPPGDWAIDLGEVRESARVRLNGRDLGAVIAPPFRVRLAGARRAGNLLEVEVTNLSANRIRDLDRRKVPWRVFHDINFVNMDYKAFDASGWPLRDSGLLGPVTLRRAVPLSPAR